MTNNEVKEVMATIKTNKATIKQLQAKVNTMRAHILAHKNQVLEDASKEGLGTLVSARYGHMRLITKHFNIEPSFNNDSISSYSISERSNVDNLCKKSFIYCALSRFNTCAIENNISDEIANEVYEIIHFIKDHE